MCDEETEYLDSAQSGICQRIAFQCKFRGNLRRIVVGLDNPVLARLQDAEGILELDGEFRIG